MIAKFTLCVCELWTAACAPECSNGAKKCFGPTASDCCPFYLNSMCVDQCSENMTPDEDFFCVCTNFFTGPFYTGRQ